MGASDNLIAGLAGATAAGQDIVGLLLGSKIRERERRNLLQDELELYRQKLPLQTSEDVRQKQLTSDIDFKRALALLPHQTEARKEVAASYPNVLVDEQGNPISTIRGRVTKIGASPEEKESAKLEAAKIKSKPIERGMLRNTLTELDSFEDAIDNLLSKPLSVAFGRIGPPRALSKERRDVESLMKQLEAKSGFSSLQNMRQNSPTGGAMGNVSDRDIQLLINESAALSMDQSEDQARKQLLKLKGLKRHVRNNALLRYEEHYGEPFVESGGFLDISRKAARPPLESFEE